MEKYNYALDLDKETLQQFELCASQKFVTAAALMADSHLGYVAPIGSVLMTKDFVVPAWVGFDIGCGVLAIKLKGKNILEKVQNNKEKIYQIVKKVIPMGLGKTNKGHEISKESKKKFEELLEKFQKKPFDKKILQFISQVGLRDLGTLGAGNHFISLNQEENQQNKNHIWLIVHSGSRGLGHEVAKKYMIKTSKSKTKYEETSPLKANSDLGKEYLNVVEFGLEYALLNRLEMSRRLEKALSEFLKIKVKSKFWTNKNHNHVIPEKEFFVHRKGAIPAKKRERGIVAGNMRDGCFLVKGKGDKKFLESSSHGAGRAMSRKEAKEKISKKEFEKEMKGIKTSFVIDEAPMAYKNIFQVMQKQEPSVKILKHLMPIINWQG